METFFESGIGLAILLGIAFTGLLIKLFSDIRINKLVKQTKNMGETKDRQLKQWKFKFENTYRMNRGMNNVLVYIKKNFRQYRICGIPLERFDRINVTLACLIVLATLVFSALTVWRNMNVETTVMYCFSGALFVGVMLIWERVCYTSEKKEYIINNILDFYENTLMRKLELGSELRNSDKNNKPAEASTGENKKVKKYAPIEEKIFNPEVSIPNSGFRRDLTEAGEINPMAEERVRDNSSVNFSRNGRVISGSAEEARQRRDSEKMRKDVEYLKQSLDRIAAGREPEYVHPTRKLTESEEKLIEEFIKEYL